MMVRHRGCCRVLFDIDNRVLVDTLNVCAKLTPKNEVRGIL